MNGINAKMRINFGARIFNIISILNVEERNEMLEILVEESVK
jgi:head-tail adaptor